MSHFVTLVLVPSPENVQQQIDALLAPYSENLSVDPHLVPCYCIGRQAERWAVEEWNRISQKTPQDIRTGYWARVDADEIQASNEAWEQETGWYWKGREELERTHPLHGKPDRGCEDCRGTGERETTYNPASKWDWYVIGGRWNGVLDQYDPTKDERNYEVCRLCRGTGKRMDKLAQEFRAKDPTYGCNGCDGCDGCDGTGRALKYTSGWVPQENVRRVRDIRADFVPFACVTPDGKWWEKGKMGWWAIVQEEVEEAKWEGMYKQLITQYPDHYGVIVDCHI